MINLKEVAKKNGMKMSEFYEATGISTDALLYAKRTGNEERHDEVALAGIMKLYNVSYEDILSMIESYVVLRDNILSKQGK